MSYPPYDSRWLELSRNIQLLPPCSPTHLPALAAEILFHSRRSKMPQITFNPPDFLTSINLFCPLQHPASNKEDDSENANKSIHYVTLSRSLGLFSWMFNLAGGCCTTLIVVWHLNCRFPSNHVVPTLMPASQSQTLKAHWFHLNCQSKKPQYWQYTLTTIPVIFVKGCLPNCMILQLTHANHVIMLN